MQVTVQPVSSRQLEHILIELKERESRNSYPISVERFFGTLFNTPTIPAILSSLNPAPPSISRSSGAPSENSNDMS